MKKPSRRTLRSLPPMTRARGDSRQAESAACGWEHFVSRWLWQTVPLLRANHETPNRNRFPDFLAGSKYSRKPGTGLRRGYNRSTGRRVPASGSLEFILGLTAQPTLEHITFTCAHHGNHSGFFGERGTTE